MIHVIAIVEGQTEEKFINEVVYEKFILEGICITSQLVNHRGGDLKYDRVFRDVCKALKQRGDAFVTTFFDLHRLHNQFPKFDEATKKNDIYQRVQYLERAFANEVIEKTPCHAQRFFPHIQPHEFEALLFSDIRTLITLEPDWSTDHECQLNAILKKAENPELINGGDMTKPSARLKLLKPKYDKTLHGSLGAKKVSLDKIRQSCQHFDGWMTKISDLKEVNL
jgi:hypothetical protein